MANKLVKVLVIDGAKWNAKFELYLVPKKHMKELEKKIDAMNAEEAARLAKEYDKATEAEYLLPKWRHLDDVDFVILTHEDIGPSTTNN